MLETTLERGYSYNVYELRGNTQSWILRLELDLYTLQPFNDKMTHTPFFRL